MSRSLFSAADRCEQRAREINAEGGDATVYRDHIIARGEGWTVLAPSIVSPWPWQFAIVSRHATAAEAARAVLQRDWIANA